jgi:hypothetical protein
MKRTRNLPLSLAALVTLALLATTATASAHTWKVNNVKAERQFEVQGRSTLYFHEVAQGTSMKFACELVEKAVVGPGNLGEITAVTNSSGKTPIACTIVERGHFCTESAEVEPEKLPWATELAGIGAKLWDGWKAYWKITCTSGAGKFSEQCSGLEAPKAENLGLEVALDFGSQFNNQELACESYPIKLEGSEHLKLTHTGTLSVE